jgi:POT family proton-dependent oligopeptide transporter
MLAGLYVVLLPWLRTDIAVYLGTAVVVPVVAILLQNTAVAGLLLGIFGGGALLLLAADAYRAERVERERMYVVLILMFFSMLFWAFFEQAGSSVSNFTDRNVDRIVGGRVLAETDVGTTLERLPITSALLGRTVADRQWNLHLVDTAQSVARETVVAAAADASNAEIQSAVNKAALEAVDRLIEESGDAPVSALKPANVVSESKPGSAGPNATGQSGTGRTAKGGKKPVPDDWRFKLQRSFLAKELHPTLENIVVTKEMVGMKVDGREVKASIFQAVNPVVILIFGLPLTLLWTLLASLRVEPNTAVKFSLGLLQLGLGFGVLWLGTQNCSQHGIVAMGWLLLGYTLHTTGELCLSPVGLSMVSKLSPARMVSTVMGAWFLATGFSNYLAGMIAALTGIAHGDDDKTFPPPIDTVHVYGGVFAQIAIAGLVSAALLLLMSPILVRWMHAGEKEN